jgi:hypothetical protein
MANYFWNVKVPGDWGTASNWTPAGGPPGAVPSNADTANLISSGGTGPILVSVGFGESFNLGDLNISAQSNTRTVDLEIQAGAGLTTTELDLVNGSNNAAHLNVNNSGTLNIVATLTSNFADSINIDGTGNGPGGGGLLQFGGPGKSGIGVNSTNITFNFLDNGPGIESDGLVEYLSGFVSGSTTTQQSYTNVSWGDGFIFDGADFTGDTVKYDPVAHTITVGNGPLLVLTMDNVSAAPGTQFVAFGDEIAAVCYARGTLLRTPDGELPVEKLRSGKQVITLVDGQEIAKTVTWLGHRRIDLASHPRPETVAPVRIRRDAFADGLPHRDLIVSPDHAIFVDGQLICARQLVNGSTIRQENNWTAVDYYHVELDQHAILVAEGLPAESYIDTGNSGFFENSGAPLVLHPDLTDETGYPTREAGSCAPFVWDEASVRPVWQCLADRAAAIGRPMPLQATTTDADLRLFGKYRTVKPIYGDSNLVIFNLPRGANEVRLLSRAQSPTEARPWLDDRRRLGVCVKRIVLRGMDELREVPMDHLGLTTGWWDIERDGQMMSRWTDGDAVVPLPKMGGPVMLELHLAGEMIYAVEVTPESQAERRAA